MAFQRPACTTLLLLALIRKEKKKKKGWSRLFLLFRWVVLREDIGMMGVSVREESLCLKHLIAALAGPLGCVTKSILMISM